MKTFVYGLIFLLIGFGIFSVINLGILEKNNPTIHFPDKFYTNLKAPISIRVTDDTGVKEIKISLLNGDETQTLLTKKIEDKSNDVNISFNFPQNTNKKEYSLQIEAVDDSFSNFFAGNKSVLNTKFIIDTKRPELYTLNQSYKIEKGGSAAVVFSAKDDIELEELYIQTDSGHRFKPTPFVKEGFYASLVAWPIHDDNFGATVVAIDKAKNKSTARIRYYFQDRKYKVSKIALNDRFLNGKILDLANQYAQDPDRLDKIGKFKFVNETLRTSNEDKIKQITSKVPEKMLDRFFIRPFYPIRNGAAVASFGDHRYYTYNGSEISESYHLGLDLASIAGADIKINNSSVVVFGEDNGIYGLNLILYHGFGLYTLYGHCSTNMTNLGDKISSEKVIATTGATGLALGDHLHFGVLVQGIEVRPEEWMDTKWMKDNIYDVLDGGRKIIEKR